jgi:hypothetical protein
VEEEDLLLAGEIGGFSLFRFCLLLFFMDVSNLDPMIAVFSIFVPHNAHPFHLVEVLWGRGEERKENTSGRQTD